MAKMRSYTAEFLESSVALVVSHGLPVRQAALRLGIPPHTLDGWVRKARGKRVALVTKTAPKTLADAEARVRVLEAEVRRLTLEKDILKKRRRTSRESSCEVRLHSRCAGAIVQRAHGVSIARCEPERVLPLSHGATFATQGEAMDHRGCGPSRACGVALPLRRAEDRARASETWSCRASKHGVAHHARAWNPREIREEMAPCDDTEFACSHAIARSSLS